MPGLAGLPDRPHRDRDRGQRSKAEGARRREGWLGGGGIHIYMFAHLVEGEPELLRDEGRAREHGDILQVAAAPVAEARGLDRAHIEHAAHLVEHQRRERLTRHIVCSRRGAGVMCVCAVWYMCMCAECVWMCVCLSLCLCGECVVSVV